MMTSTTRMMAYCRNHFGMYAVVSLLLLSSITWTTAGDITSPSQLAQAQVVVVAEESSRPEQLPVPMPLTLQQEGENLENGARRKRDLSSDLLDAAGSIGVGGSYLKKFNNLIHGVPPNVRDAFIEQDFSNVSEADIRNLNISVLEFIPPKVISKMNITYLNPLVERLLQANKPMALGRVMQAMGDKMDSNQLLDKVKQAGGMNDQNEEAASVLLYTALNQVGDKGGLNTAMIRRLTNDGLLNLIPEEQLMKVTDPNAAKQLLNRLYSKAAGDTSELDDTDDKALIYKLVETGYGNSESWSSDTIRQVGSKILAYMPATFLKQLNPDVVASSISTLRESKFESPLQAKSVTDVFLQKNGITNTEAGASEPGVGNLGGIMGSLGTLAAFVNPSLSSEPSILNSIISACDKLNLPAPLKAITGMIKQKIGGTGRKIEDLGFDDLKDMGVSVLKNGPPQLLDQAMKRRVLNEDDLNEIAQGTSKGDLQNNGGGGQVGAGLFSSTFLQGIIAQVSQYAIQFFTRGGKINLGGLPGAFLGALGIKGLNDMSNRDLDDAVDKLKNNPDSLDDAQKALLLKKLRDAGMLDSLDLPPEIRNLQPRKKEEDANYDNILDGLPSDAELRLIHGHGKKITAQMLERDKFLVGTLTPKQVEDIELEEIPAVLAVVRKSKDGPQAQTLEALSKRFAQYIRGKSEDYESPDKKLLKYITAAEVSKLPATVLAYFIDQRQTSKLPPAVRKEIMIAMGELSTKDHAIIPGKTRNEIILQGLDALDAITGGSSKIDIPELAAIGNGVADLPAEKIESLTPVALETAMQIIQGSSDDDDDGLRQRACLTPDQRKAWRNKIVQTYGEPSTWDSVKISSLCCALGILDEHDLHQIMPDALATCRCAADSPPPSHLSELKKALDVNCKHELKEQDLPEPRPKQTLEKVKSEMAFDLEDLESQILTRRKRHDHSEHEHSHSHEGSELTCFKVRLTGSAAQFSKEQLETLKESEMGNCIYELGVEPLGVENARVLWKKMLATKPNNKVTAEDVRYAGHILSGITLNDVNELDLKDPDILLAFGKPLGLSKNVLEKLATRLEQETGKSVQDFTTEDLVVANNILCGFSADQLTQINGESFRDALPVLKNIDPSCEQTRIAALAVVTIREQVFGSPSQWTSADVRGAGTIVNGLSVPSIKSIPPESFMGITPTVAESLSDSVLSELSPEQIENIPRFSAQALSEEQIEALPEEAQDKLKSVVRGPLVSHAVSSLQQHKYHNILSLALCIPLLVKFYQLCNL